MDYGLQQPTEFDSAHQRIRHAAAHRRDFLTADGLEVSADAMARMEAEGALVRVATGIYLGATVARHPLCEAAAWAVRHPRAAICLYTAATYYELTDAFPRGIWLAIPRGASVPRSRSADLRVIQSAPRLLDVVGAEVNGLDRLVVHGATVTVTGLDRTVLDLWRFPDLVPREHALVALGRRVRAPDFRAPRFARLARRLRVWRQIEPVLQGATL